MRMRCGRGTGFIRMGIACWSCRTGPLRVGRSLRDAYWASRWRSRWSRTKLCAPFPLLREIPQDMHYGCALCRGWGGHRLGGWCMGCGFRSHVSGAWTGHQIGGNATKVAGRWIEAKRGTKVMCGLRDWSGDCAKSTGIYRDS